VSDQAGVMTTAPVNGHEKVDLSRGFKTKKIAQGEVNSNKAAANKRPVSKTVA